VFRQHNCNNPDCNNAQLPPADFRALGGPSAATDAYAVFALVVILTTSLIFFALGDFAVTVGSEVDLPRLSEQLQNVVRDAMRPEHVSLWLRPAPSPTSDSAKRRDVSIT
jgi:hypothetical protein